MSKYQNGQIYKIVDVGFHDCYIGSTCEKLYKRFSRHKIQYNSYKINGKRYQSSFLLFDKYGLENCKILWIEDYPCDSKKELEKREGEIQQQTDCINKRIAGRTYEEWYEQNRQEESERKKKYRRDNPDKMKEQSKKQYEKHRDKRLAPYECECGSTVVYDCKARHFKTKKHQQYLQSQNNPQE